MYANTTIYQENGINSHIKHPFECPMLVQLKEKPPYTAHIVQVKCPKKPKMDVYVLPSKCRKRIESGTAMHCKKEEKGSKRIKLAGCRTG